ncbi:MAG: Kazal-type serine protease inhibitor [Candidatus Micrarchaeia archaeon]
MQMQHIILVSSLLAVLMLGGCVGELACYAYDPVCATNGVTYNNTCLAEKAGATVIGKGTCESLCTDTDGGKDIFTSGTAVGLGTTLYDQCADGEIKESFCQNGQPKSQVFACPYKYECKGGACVESKCVDSDGGDNISAAGTAVYSGKEYEDTCSGNIVTEYLCKDGVLDSRSVSCPQGQMCKDGACVPIPCTDSDGGKEAGKYGEVTVLDKIYKDSCSGNSVKEYYCMNGEAKYEEIACASGYSCKSGECVLDTCDDNDGGAEPGIRGTTTYGSITRTDSCYSETAVSEHYCPTLTSISTVIIECPSGQECSDGRCRAVTCRKTEIEVDDNDKKLQISKIENKFILHIGDAVEVGSNYILRLDGIGSSGAIFSVFNGISKYRSDSELCTFNLANGSSTSTLCGKSISTLRVRNLADGPSLAQKYVVVEASNAYVSEFYSAEGTITDWTDSVVCRDDEYYYDSFTAEFFPYLDTNSSSLNLANKGFTLFNSTATIKKVVPGESVKITLDGDTYMLTDGSSIEYRGEDYTVGLEFALSGGLKRISIEPG